MKKIRKEVLLNEVHLDVLEKIINNTEGVNNISEAIRFAILNMDSTIPQQSNGPSDEMKKKLNTIAKEINIISEIVAGGFHAQDVKALGNKEETFIYQDAVRNTEKTIQKAVTAGREKKEKRGDDKVESKMKIGPSKLANRSSKIFN